MKKSILHSMLLTAILAIYCTIPVSAQTHIYKNINGDFNMYEYSHYSTTSANQKHTVIFTIDSNEVVSDGIKIYIDAPPFIENGTTLLPLKAVSESISVLGNYVSVNWNSADKKAIISYKDNNIIFTPNSITYTVNGEVKIINGTAPIIKNGRIYIPLRTLANALQLNINWNQNTKEITITNAG